MSHSDTALAIRNVSPARQGAHVELIRDFLNDSRIRGLSEGTLAPYQRVYEDFFLTTGRIPVAQLRPRDIREFLAWQQKRGASDQTLRRSLCALRSLFRFAEAIEIVAVSPARAVQTRRFSRKLPKTLSESSVNRLTVC